MQVYVQIFHFTMERGFAADGVLSDALLTVLGRVFSLTRGSNSRTGSPLAGAEALTLAPEAENLLGE